MFNLRSAVRALLLSAPMFLTAGLASAAVITGTSGGNFSSISSCSGFFDNCRINNSGNGANTQLEWGYTNLFDQPGSTLTAVDRAWSQPTDANDVILAELVWFNRATLGLVTPDVFNVNYALTINFTSPNAAADSETFNLTITNPTNITGDNIAGLALADLTNLSFALGSVNVSDLKYVLAGGAGSTFASNFWYNPESTTSRLYITADFTESVAVPEPGSLWLLAAGILGLGTLRLRRRV